VWEVERSVDQTRFAMKLVLPGENFTRENFTALRHEYSVASALDHPNVVRAEDFVQDSFACYVILELFRSSSLKQLIQDAEPRLPQLAEKIIRGAAEGLAYFHRQGWIHCDVKPDNFLANTMGEVKLIDFNISQRRRGALARLFFRGSKAQGTQSYMSPEQIRSKVLDERADVYGFGCVVHELISGKPPFTGSTSNELLNKHLKSQPPALSPKEHGVTPAFSRLVQRMLSKDPGGRPENLELFLAELDEAGVFANPPRNS